MLTDEQVMAAIAAGDQHAYAQAVRQHGRSLAAYAWRMLGSQSEAEDIIQETFLRLWIHADSWVSGRASLSTWLHRIAHNLCIDHLRRGHVAKREPLDNEQPDGTPDAAQLLDREAARHQLQNALASLPERQRSALIMTHYQGLSNKDVAEIMGVSVDALESLLARARDGLRKRLSQTGGGGGGGRGGQCDKKTAPHNKHRQRRARQS